MLEYCDIHSHFLPGVDDGAKDMDETIRMLSIAYQEGFRTIVATPHYKADGQNILVSELQELLCQVKEASHSISNDFEFILGHELFYSTGLIASLKNQEALTLNKTRYILLEFLPDMSFCQLKAGLNDCIYAGFLPILAHAERYHELVQVPKRTKELIDLGAYIQINFSSIHKSCSKRTRFCHTLLRQEWVHFIGTDSHGVKIRAPIAQKAIKILKKKYGEATVKRLLWDNPITILENKII